MIAFWFRVIFICSFAEVVVFVLCTNTKVHFSSLRD
jgi:hypothetical protein